MSCSRCQGQKKLCYECLSKLVASQSTLIDKMYKVSRLIYSRLDTTLNKSAIYTWRQVEEEEELKIRL